MKKILKILALILAVVLLCVVGWFANAFLGNPVSKALAVSTANEYMAAQYGDTDYYIESVGYSFKTMDYYAHVRSPSSIDTQFVLYLDMLGNLERDTYESVLSGSITARRIESEYRAYTDRVFDSPEFPYSTDIAYGTLEIWDRESLENPAVTDAPAYAIAYEELVLDRVYDPGELGARAGHLVVYVDSDTVTVEYAAEILLTLRAEFDRAGVAFRAVDLTLHHPLPEEGPRDDTYVGVKDFCYDDIVAEGLEDRVAAADAALKAYYAEMDKMK